MATWLGSAEQWFDFMETVGVIGGLFFTAISVRSETRMRRISNLLELTQNHQRLWLYFHQRPDLARVLDAAPDLKRQPVKLAETEFVNLVVQHLNSVYQAMKTGHLHKPGGVRYEVLEFFSLPIPRKVWEEIKVFQDDDFVAFVESCRDLP